MSDTEGNRPSQEASAEELAEKWEQWRQGLLDRYSRVPVPEGGTVTREDAPETGTDTNAEMHDAETHDAAVLEQPEPAPEPDAAAEAAAVMAEARHVAGIAPKPVATLEPDEDLEPEADDLPATAGKRR